MANKNELEKLDFHRIKKGLNFIKGEVIDINGIKADYSQAYFIQKYDNAFNKDLDSLLEKECNASDIIYMFYGHLHPYIKAALDDNHKLFNKVQTIAKDADETVKMYAELKFKFDHAMDFIKASGLSRDFESKLRVEKNKLSKQMDKVSDKKYGEQLTLL